MQVLYLRYMYVWKEFFLMPIIFLQLFISTYCTVHTYNQFDLNNWKSSQGGGWLKASIITHSFVIYPCQNRLLDTTLSNPV